METLSGKGKKLRNVHYEHKILSRTKLINLLTDNADKNVIFIYSPPGYGKTSLVKDYLVNENIIYSELIASKEIDFIYTFFKYLVGSLRKLNPDFGINTIQIIESRRLRYQLSSKIGNVIQDVISTFYNEFKLSFSDDISILIEDLQNIEDLFNIEESNWAIKTFNMLFSKVPENLHFIITTRQLPDLNFTQLIIKNKLLKLGIEDLKFQNDEIKELLWLNFGTHYKDKDILLLKDNLGGWITGINLLLQAFGKDFNKIQMDYQKIPENTFNFLAEGIFMNMNENVKDFLLNTALLDDFNEDITDYLLEIQDSYLIIEELIAKNLFITSKQKSLNNYSENGSYQYQVLFKRYLVSKLYEMKSKEQIKLLLDKIYLYYHKKGNIITALNYLMLANDFEKAIPVIIDNFQKLFNDGKFEFLWKWLSSFDKDEINRNPHLMYFMGVLYKFFVGDLDTSLSFLNTAITKMEKTNDEHSLIKCYINKASVLVNLGKPQEALKEISRLLKYENTKENQANLLYFSAFASYQMADYENSLKYLEKSLVICEEEKLNDIIYHIYNITGHINLIKGDYGNAIKYYEKVVENNSNVIDKFETMCNLILLYSQSGKFNKSEEFLIKLENLLKQFPSPIFKIPFLLAKQAYFYESACYEENIKLLDEINNIAVSMNYKKHIYLSHRLLIDTYYYLDNTIKINENYNKALEYLDNENELEKIEMAVVKALLMKRNMQIDPTIELVLLQAYNYYSTNNFHYYKAQICFNLGDYYYKLKNKSKALIYLEECFKICSEKGYISYLKRELSHSSDLIKFSSFNNVYKKFLSDI